MNLRDNEERLWRACLKKDSAFDGRFVLAVRTTGIYCRPSCPARKPKRENVSFFALPHLAQQAGFRACKRCQPDIQTIVDPQLVLVSEMCRHIEAHSSESLTLQSLGDHFHVSAAHLQRVFKGIAGISPQDYTEACRMNQLKSALRAGMAISDATYEAGFGSSSRVYEKAAPQMGMTPRDYQQGGVGRRITFAIAPSALGQVLVATTERGVCAVKLGDDAGELEALLRNEFSAAEILRDDDAHRDWVQAILAFVAGPRAAPRPTIGRARNRVSKAGLGCVAAHSVWRNAQLRRCGCSHRPAHSRAGGGAGLRRKSHCADRAVPSRRSKRWLARRVSLGRGTQAPAVGAGSEFDSPPFGRRNVPVGGWGWVG